MGNTQDKILNDPEINKIKPKFSPLEMYMLGILFKDLAARNGEFIDKETFLHFFPLTGLWGERLFEKFDYKHTGYINFYGFLQGIACCCKSTEDDKIHLLFSLYDMDQDGYIKKKEMITMLYNYPKNHIKFITEEIAPDRGEKLEQVSEARRMSLNNLDEIDNILISPNVHEEKNQPISCHSEHLDGALNDELVVAEEDKKPQKFLPVQREISKSYSFYSQRESQIKMQLGVINDANKNKKLPALDVRGLEDSTKRTAEQVGSPDYPDRKNSLDKNIPRKAANKSTLFAPDPLRLAAGRKSSTSTVILDQSFVAATTVNTRIKEYASFIFKNFEGANTRGKISYEEFKQWIAMHPMILKVFDETFHQNIWATPELSNMTASYAPRKSTLSLQGHLQYKDKPAEVSGYLYKTRKVMKGWKKRFFELREHFLFYYNKKDDKQPKGVIFLDGCEVEELKDFNTTKKYGFKISHKSDTYENFMFYSTDKQEYDQWMSILKEFNTASILQRYTFHEKIGTGKFSVVYRATSKQNQQEYAIKVIDKKLLKPEEKEFLLSETSVMKILDHPNVIKLIDTIETKSHIYIITEIVKDGDLFDYIINREYLDEYDASFIMKQLITSIYFLHNIGIIHRDLKPENILITLGDHEQVKELKIIDFGFAKLINENTQLTDTCGTPNYVAPEVLRGTGYDKTADIWSLGVIMYLMVRGYLPFDAHDVNVILKNTLRAEIPIEDEHFDKVSPEAKDLIKRFLHKDPRQRISLKDAITHPWIKNREELKKYNGVNRTGTNESASGADYYGAV